MLVSQAIKINKNTKTVSCKEISFLELPACTFILVIINIIQVNLDFTRSRKCTKYGDIFHAIWLDRYKTTPAETVFILKWDILRNIKKTFYVDSDLKELASVNKIIYMHSTVKLDCVSNYCLNKYNSRFVKDAKCWVSMMESLQML